MNDKEWYDFLAELKAKNDIVDVISSYLPVRQKGRGFWALCPFHNDRNPSLSINREGQYYHCFVCGAGGDIFRFIQNYENCTFMEAVDILAQRANVRMPQFNPEAEKNIAMCCHLAGLAGLFLPYVGNILGPMIVWAWKKDSSAFVDLQGKSAVNYQICLSMAAFCLLVAGVILSVICIGFLISILSLLLMFAGMFFPIIAALYAREGKQYLYPLSYPFIR